MSEIIKITINIPSRQERFSLYLDKFGQKSFTALHIYLCGFIDVYSLPDTYNYFIYEPTINEPSIKFQRNGMNLSTNDRIFDGDEITILVFNPLNSLII